MQGSTSSTSGQGRGAVTRDSFAWSAVRSQLKESLAEFRVSVTGSRRLNLSGVQQWAAREPCRASTARRLSREKCSRVELQAAMTSRGRGAGIIGHPTDAVCNKLDHPIT